MAKTEKVSAGILLYRFSDSGLQVLLALPGGPFYNSGSYWGIPKGGAHKEESLVKAAKREFLEETGLDLTDEKFLVSLGQGKTSSGKMVHIFALERDWNTKNFKSNLFEMEWPKKSGNMKKFPEIAEVRWFDFSEAERIIQPYQSVFLKTLRKKLYPMNG